MNNTRAQKERKMKRSKLTVDKLKDIIAEEKAKLMSLGLLKEDKVSNKINLKETVDYLKKLNLKETKLRKELEKVKLIKKQFKNTLTKIRK